MNSITVSSIVFAVVFGGAMLGMFLRTVLPKNHLADDSKDIVKLGMGLVATMSALLLSLLISSAKTSFDVQSSELTNASSKVILVDRTLADYGPESKEVRNLLVMAVVTILKRMDTKLTSSQLHLIDPASVCKVDCVYDKARDLSPKDDKQRMAQAQALSLLMDLRQTRWLLFEQESTSISTPLLVVLVFWLATLFMSFGLFAPSNGTVVATLFVSALSVSAAILLILELYSPYEGLIKISSAPLRAALSQLGQ